MIKAELNNESSSRTKGVQIVKPIVFGSVARSFGKKRDDDGHTHQWTIYVKPYCNEDLSTYVKKIHFKLHESYANQNRIITKPPYEVTETGWGEFEIIIKIYFMDPNEKPVTLYHFLRLFQHHGVPGLAPVLIANKTVVSEFYDELVFQDPTGMMQQLLSSPRQLTLGAWKHETDFVNKEEKTLAAIVTAKAKIRQEITELNERLKLGKTNLTKLKKEIETAEKDEDAKKM